MLATQTVTNSLRVTNEVPTPEHSAHVSDPVDSKNDGFSNDTSDDDIHQDVLAQFPLLNGYNIVVFGFQTDNTIDRNEVSQALHNAFDQITEHIPWLAGQVVHEPGSKPGDWGMHKPAPWPTEGKHAILTVKDCDHLLPGMKQIVRAGAPVSMLDGKVLAPWPAMPAPHGLDPPHPVVQLQANFTHGGLILTFSFNHVAMDASGMIQVMRLLSTVLRGRKISTADLEQANRDRQRVVPLIPRGEPVKDFSHLRKPPGFIPPVPTTPSKWAYFKVPLAVLPNLRKLATSSSAPGASIVAVSDNDILNAFCWQRISVVRLARGFSPDRPTKYTRAIDGRSVMGIPSSYIGHMVHHSIAQLPLGVVANSPLSTVAQTLRRELNAANTPWALRSYATFLAREPDKSQIVYCGLRDVNVDLGATSVVASASDEKNDGQAMPEDFGPLLGKVCFLRRPNVTPLSGTITITPAENGALPVALCLPDAELEALKKDGEWRRYMRFVG